MQKSISSKKSSIEQASFVALSVGSSFEGFISELYFLFIFVIMFITLFKLRVIWVWAGGCLTIIAAKKSASKSPMNCCKVAFNKQWDGTLTRN